MMGALPSFAQMQTSANGLAGSPLGTIGGEQADLLGFGALLSQSAPNAAANSGSAEQGAGHFQDVNVILQLLRSSQSDMDAPLAANNGQAPTAALPANGDAAAPLAALPFDLSQIGQATTQDLLDMAAKLAEQIAAPAPTTSEYIIASQNAAALMSAKLPQSATDTSSDAPTDVSPFVDPAEPSDHASTQARQQAEALDILLSLSSAAPTGTPAAPIIAASLAAAGNSIAPTAATPATDGHLAALDQSSSSVNVADMLMAPATTQSRKPVGQSTAPWTLAQAEQRSAADPAMAAPSTLLRGMTSSGPPLAMPSLAPSTAAPATDLGAAMSVMITTGTTNASPVSAASAADAAQTVPEHWLDMHGDDAWIEQLAKDIAATKSATGDISFRLMPRHLGRLDVSMMQSEQGVSVHMDTQHEQTAAIVTAAQGRLVDELRQQGVRVAGADVTHTPQDMTRQNSNGQGRSSQNELHHLIETASERLPDTDSDDKGTADRHGRFA